MGCGASIDDTPDEEVPKHEQASASFAEESPGSTWATKTEPLFIQQGERFADAWAAGSRGSPPGFHTGISSLVGRGDETVLLVDAEDDEEIEIIQEATHKERRSPLAANAQEAPQAASIRSTSSKAAQSVSSLSKQQMEEAAKLAERRKLFDNQRYQRPDAAGDVGGYPLQGSPAVVPSGVSKPDAGMILGLNLTDSVERSNTSVPAQGSFLPGGIQEEEGEQIQASRQRKKMNRHHDDEDLDSAGFDADDERLMKEILENCDDI
mmetsp:Transcript_63292/g.99999  ORF Transcript_63292/g.99999 Transcript_63292/m.99999 type:complete len:265 (-) Transcript_63292:110-904(-)